MFRRLHLAAALAALLAASSPLAAQTTELTIKALDQRGRVLPGIRFAFGGVESLATTDAGVTGLAVPEMAAGEAMKLDLPRGLAEEWFLVDSTVHAPAGPKEGPAEVVLMRRAEFRELAGGARDAPAGAADELSEAQRRQAVAEYATAYGLDETELERAIAAFRESAEDPMDEGVAAYLAREWAQAEPLFRQALADAEERREEAEEDIAERRST